jgi:hypothetical protein
VSNAYRSDVGLGFVVGFGVGGGVGLGVGLGAGVSGATVGVGAWVARGDDDAVASGTTARALADGWSLVADPSPPVTDDDGPAGAAAVISRPPWVMANPIDTANATTRIPMETRIAGEALDPARTRGFAASETTTAPRK